jgi:hypothetical protein
MLLGGLKDVECEILYNGMSEVKVTGTQVVLYAFAWDYLSVVHKANEAE